MMRYGNILFINHDCTSTQLTFIYNLIDYNINCICTQKITTAIYEKFSAVDCYLVNEPYMQNEEEKNIYDYNTLGKFTLLLNFDRIELQH